MNTLEKRKLEGIISSKIAQSRSAYSSKRNAEFHAKRVAINAKPPAAITKIADSYKLENTRHEKAVKDFRKEASAAGYELEQRYDGDIRITPTQEAPELKEHEAKTAATLQKLSALSDDYTIAVWSESEDMGKLFKRLSDDLAKLTS